MIFVRQSVPATLGLSCWQNRINRLLIEQERANKRIAETKRRAEEVSQLKQRNQANAAARADASSWLSSEQALQRELLLENREQRSKAIASSKTAMHQLRRDEVRVLKQMRHENEEAVQVQREMERMRAVERKTTVREHQRSAIERKQVEMEAAMVASAWAAASHCSAVAEATAMPALPPLAWSSSASSASSVG